MRVLQIMASRTNGGVETISTDMMVSLHNAGIEEIAVISRRSIHFARLGAAGLRVEADALDADFGLTGKLRIRSIVKRFKPDLINCWSRRSASIVPRVDVPVIGWFGGYNEPRRFGQCRYFIGLTPDIAQHIIARGVAPERTYYVPTFPTLEPSPAFDRALLSTPNNVTVLLALSRLHENKGLDTMLRALVDLPSCYLWIAGDGPLEHELKALAKTLGVAERVRFLGWRTDRGALLRTADICVLPSRREPFGAVMLEAWAAGTPLVAAAAKGPAALIKSGADGLLVPIDDAPALTATLANLIADHDLRARIIQGGLAEFQRGYTREAVTQRLITVYRDVLAAASR